MKKIISAVLLVALLAVGASFTTADGNSNEVQLADPISPGGR